MDDKVVFPSFVMWLSPQSFRKSQTHHTPFITPLLWTCQFAKSEKVRPIFKKQIYLIFNSRRVWCVHGEGRSMWVQVVLGPRVVRWYGCREPNSSPPQEHYETVTTEPSLWPWEVTLIEKSAKQFLCPTFIQWSCACRCMWTWHRACVSVIGQLIRLGSLRPPCEFHSLNSLPGLMAHAIL